MSEAQTTLDFDLRSPHTPQSNTTSNEQIAEMGRGRSPHHSDRRVADHQSRPRSRERSPPLNQPDSSRFIRQDHSSERHTQGPSRKELFPNRRPRSREREIHPRPAPDHRDTNSVDKGREERRYQGRHEQHLSTSIKGKESKPISRNDEYHGSKHVSRTPSPHNNRKRRRERSRSPPGEPLTSKHGKVYSDIPKHPRSGVNATDLKEFRTKDSPRPSYPEPKHRHEREDLGHPNDSYPHEREKHRKSSYPERGSLSGRNLHQDEQRVRDERRKDGTLDSGKRSSKKRRRGSKRSRSPKEHRPMLNQQRDFIRDYSQSPEPFSPALREKNRDKYARHPSRDAPRRNTHSNSPQRDRMHSPLPPSGNDKRGRTSREDFHRIRERSPNGDHIDRLPSGRAEGRFSPPRNQRTHSPSGDSGYQHRHRRSRSRSFHSPSAPVDRVRAHREPPDPYSKSAYRGRPYPPPPRHLGNSPPYTQYPPQDYHDDWSDRGGWGEYDRGR
jgi:hypothetical protein